MVNNMKIWINKCEVHPCTDEFENSIIFNVDIAGQGGLLTSDIREAWYKILGIRALEPLYEDLFLLSLAVFGVDKRVGRTAFSDSWTRSLHVSVPVIEYDKWCMAKPSLEKMLTFLSGDLWIIDFRQSGDARYQSRRKRAPHRPDNLDLIEGVSLFSGGLDSLCGAYEFMERGQNTLFVSFKEYGKLPAIQTDLIESMKANYPNTVQALLTFTAKAYQPLGENPPRPENTSRSRSFLFLCSAICAAGVIGKEIPVYIPENGFIGLNLPLTEGRKGSCSTRTTHPHFLSMFNKLLGDLGMAHRIINPYAFWTKREMVDSCIGYSGFIDQIAKTISCSHPCNGRWRGNPEPENCGYCYPCLIRKASLIGHIIPDDRYTEDELSYDYIQRSSNAKHSDLTDLCSAINKAYHSTDAELLRRIKKTGSMTTEEAIQFRRLYKETISDLIELLSADSELLRTMGIEYATH